MNGIKNFNLSHFLKLEHFKKGYELLKLQIDEKHDYNFRCIDLEIYRNEKYLDGFDVELYYNKYIKKDLLYNYLDLFYNKEYTIPKGNYGVRNFHFTSFHLQVLYYSLGFYIQELLEPTLAKYKTLQKFRQNFNTYYGGNIDFNKPERSEIKYQKDYKKFTLGINKYIEDSTDNFSNQKVIAIKLDIQDFYSTINHDLLINKIEKYALPSEVVRLNFDTHTHDTIKKLLNFILNKEYGLPLSNQNLISNFISYIYLLELDNFIKDINFKNNLNLSYFRYVDDFIILYKKDSKCSNEEIGDQIQEIGHKISDHLMLDLQLKINPLKSKHFIIENKPTAAEFLKIRKFISFSSKEFKKDPQKPKEKLEEIIEVIEELKAEYRSTGPLNKKQERDDILKECFITAVKKYINSKDAITKLDEAFKDWNPILTLYSIKSLLFLSTHSKEGKSLLKKYLIKNFESKIPQSQFLYLLEKYLIYDNTDQDIINKIDNKKDESSPYYTLIRRMIFPVPDFKDKTMWFSDTSLLEHDTLMQQIIKIVFAEKRNDFTLALNHLLNCFQHYCYLKDDSPNKASHKKYNRENVINCLESKLLHEDVQFIMAFYDRRNKNTISHIGDDNMENWIIKSIEYDQYKHKMQKLLEKLFPEENSVVHNNTKADVLPFAAESLVKIESTDTLEKTNTIKELGDK
ncbi:reverse transcriptase domain-containing protein [Rufibacter quisquiliarum]|uniref:Reverse transcriptase domain-containing protein n=1 Tax=Rufibacter quisquiliarum TaxID=1549639 RepID=A0A839GT32_9BACT|nr:reverse transcriptase domain-containing protein [Rufibacter quisquiliarum]MBA9077966.1 hypothetical protein [Rufibacter quisquiliarum]